MLLILDKVDINNRKRSLVFEKNYQTKYYWRSLLLFTLPLFTLGSFAFINKATAQITPDSSLGAESSVVNPDVIKGIESDRIDGGAIRGSNLFHSFQDFNVNAGRGAYFSNPAGIANILTRVTGGNPSNIQGVLGVLGNANLFLLNPKGILFGSNARLDLGGSFLATTADSFVFDNNFEFSASNAQAPPQLTINIPIGLRFRDNPGTIGVQGPGNNLQFNPEFLEFSRNSTPPPGLAVQPGKTLALVGGDVNLEGGNLLADGGRIEVGSVDSSSFVSITPVDKGWQLGYTNVPAFRDISLTKKASIDSSSEAGAGEIQVQGRNIKLTDGSGIFAFTGSQSGGNVSVNATGTLEVSGISTNDSVPSTIYTAVSPGGTGTGSNLTIQAKRLISQGGSQIGADTYGAGSAGNVFIKAAESVEIKGKLSVAGFTVPTAIGTIVQSNSTGSGSKLTLETRQLKITDGGQLVTGTISTGKAATLDITASESTEISGEGSAISSVVLGSDTTGDGGTVILKTPKLIIRDQGKIIVDGQGTGNAGEVRVTSDTIRLENQGSITAQATSGNGGDIYLDVQDYLFMSGESFISTAAINGNGGNIYINTLTNNRGFIIAQPFDNNDIIANADQGQGGQVIINSNGIFGLFVRTREDWQRLRPQDLDPRKQPTSDITAISRQNASLNGTVQLNTIDVDPSQGLVELPNNLPDPRDQIAQNPCQKGTGSEFIITGRGGFAPGPNEGFSSDNVRVDLVKPTANSSNSRRSSVNQPTIQTKQIIPAQGWIFNNKGEVVLTAYDPTAYNYQRSSRTAAVCAAGF
ncbi:MAG: filamentous hemagglutinin N-terminal domain-containing protein [Fischerella sp. CENA71]|nr:filamentous hemagglutinin N-terminal domain-containing protein [Fischerella sp. CENA71]